MQTNLQRSDGNLNIELNNNEIKTLFQSGSSKVLLPNSYNANKENSFNKYYRWNYL